MVALDVLVDRRLRSLPQVLDFGFLVECRQQRRESRSVVASGGISTSRMFEFEVRADRCRKRKRNVLAQFLRIGAFAWLSKNSLMAASDGTLRLASSPDGEADRVVVGGRQSASYPAALMAAITVKRLGLASSWPVSAGAARAGTAASRTSAST